MKTVWVCLFSVVFLSFLFSCMTVPYGSRETVSNDNTADTASRNDSAINDVINKQNTVVDKNIIMVNLQSIKIDIKSKINETDKLIRDMKSDQTWGNVCTYLGGGGGGLFALILSLMPESSDSKRIATGIASGVSLVSIAIPPIFDITNDSVQKKREIAVKYRQELLVSETTINSMLLELAGDINPQQLEKIKLKYVDMMARVYALMPI